MYHEWIFSFEEKNISFIRSLDLRDFDGCSDSKIYDDIKNINAH